MIRHTGKVLVVADLAKEYGFTDVDGSRPDVWKYMEDEEAGLDPNPESYR